MTTSEIRKIPYTKPSITPLEVEFATDAAANGWGEHCYDYIVRFEEAFKAHLGVKYAIATSSCTGALHMGMHALGVGPGDEVIMADTNWIATAAPIVHLGATPVFVDILADSWCLDPEQVEAAITPKTKAIVAVHLYGNLCEMDALLAIGARHGIPVIEDAAEAVGSVYHGKRAGSMGRFGAFSFHGTKTITRGRAQLPQEARPVPRLKANGPNQVWSWDISYLPTSVKGIWLYLYLVVDIWSRKVVAWDVEQSESAELAAQLVSRACLKERVSRRRKQPLILHADNGTSMRAATLEVRLEELGVLRSFSRPRVSNDNPYSESLFRTVKYRPNYPNRPFSSKEEACQWVSSFVDWYNHQHRHSGIKFVTPQQRHSGEAIEICRQRSRVYELARIANPKRWSRSIRCWKQPDLVWINEPLATQQTSLPVALAKEA